MSAIGFDTLKFARKLKAAGVPDEQAEAQAEVLGEAFLYNLDEIVTRDYLDAKLAKVHSRLDGLDGRMEAFEARMGVFETRMDTFEGRMGSFEARMDSLESRMASLESQIRLIAWMVGLIIVVNVIPTLTRFFS